MSYSSAILNLFPAISFKFYLLKNSVLGRSFKMVEEQDVEITFLPTNTSEIHLHVEQSLLNTY